MHSALNTLKSNQLKAPFQRAKIAVSSVWTALAVSLGFHRWVRNRSLEIENKDKNLLVVFFRGALGNIRRSGTLIAVAL